MDGLEDEQARVGEENEYDRDASLLGELLEVRRHADVLLGFLDVAADDDGDVEHVETDEHDRIEDADGAPERDEEGEGRRREQEGDFGGDAVVERHHVREKARAVVDRLVAGVLRPIDGEDGDTGPAEADENAVRASHIGDRESGVAARAADAGLPGVVGVDGVLGRDREHREHRDGEGGRNVLFCGFGPPRQQKGCAEDGESADEHRHPRRDVRAGWLRTQMEAVGDERGDERYREK